MEEGYIVFELNVIKYVVCFFFIFRVLEVFVFLFWYIILFVMNGKFWEDRFKFFFYFWSGESV